MSELIPGATAAGMSTMQCTELLETAQDTFSAVTSTLTYLLDQESKKAQPDTVLIAEWEALDDEVFTLSNFGLLNADVGTFQRVISTYQQRNNKLAVVADSYSAEQQN